MDIQFIDDQFTGETCEGCSLVQRNRDLEHQLKNSEAAGQILNEACQMLGKTCASLRERIRELEANQQQLTNGGLRAFMEARDET